MIWGFLTIIVAVVLPSIKTECELISLPRLQLCRATIKCTELLTDQSSALNSWDCIRHRRQYDYYSRYDYKEYTYDSNYELFIELKNLDINKFENPLIGLTNIGVNIVKSITMMEGNLVSVLPNIYELKGLTELVIVKNMIEKCNLTKLSYMSSLETVNMSRNSISIIDDAEGPKEGSCKVHSIDLSYNELELIPDNCFERFTHLLYLDLSHNLLNNIDILTFEGIGQLETLLLSHNQLTEIGLNFVRFTHLKKMNLDHNYLKALYEINFKTLINLEHLDVSYNQIKTIEQNTFGTLIKLQELDLEDNNINTITKSYLNKNRNLNKLYISNNYINNIERSVFEGKNISEFSIKGNRLSGTIEYKTFLGIHVDELDLTGGRITTIGDESFSDMGSELRSLNLSQNNIVNISRVGFSNLTVLIKLDLSNNNLIEIDFECKDLIELRELYLQNNRIKKISANTLKQLKSLSILNISQNALNELEVNTLAELDNLELLLLNNNDFKSLGANIFNGLKKLKKLQMIGTKIIYLQNELFHGLYSLEMLNITRAQIQRIDYETFKGTGKIKILDISFNMLVIFSVNTSSFSELKELYLNHNTIKNITELCFHNMTALEKLNLSDNNILYFHSKALQTLSHLNFFYLSSNTHVKLESDTFNNLQLSEVSLANNYSPFNFSRAKNASITTLILSECNISDIDLVSVYKIENLSKLILHSNRLTSIDKESFKKMPLLNALDLSQNMISFIQPGTFLFTDMINTLNLNGNKLQTLQFGSLDGLKNVRVLNLSSNEIREFNPNLLHNTPRLSKIFLDNNHIVKIGFKEFVDTSVTTLYIGQNPIACDQLASFKKYNLGKLNITANYLDFNTENVAGIPCTTYYAPREDKAIDSHDNSTSELRVLKTTFDDLKKIFYDNLNETNIISKSIRDVITDLSTHQNQFTKELNKSQTSLAKYFQDLLNKHDILGSRLINSNINVTDAIKAVEVSLELNNNLSYSSNSLFKAQNEMIKGFSNIDESVLSSQQYKELQQDKTDTDLDDRKVILIIIALCLAIQCLFIFSYMIYKFLIKNKRKTHSKDFHVSNRPLNVIEME